MVGLNFSDYQNSQVDAALDQVRHAPSEAVYRQGVSELQRALVNDPPAIFLAWSETFRAVSRRFDVPSDPDQDILQSVRLWKPLARAATTGSHS